MVAPGLETTAKAFPGRNARVLFLGTPAFAEPSFKALLDSPDFDVVGAVTQPDRPAGRGQKLKPPPIKRMALEKGVPLLQPERVRGNTQAADFLREQRPDVLVVAAFGQILPRDFFDLASHGAVNVHASLLPRHRGASPVVYAILNGDRETGVTIMKIDEGLDTGAMLAKRSVPVDLQITASELEIQLSELGAQLLLETLPSYLQGTLRPEPQDDRLATYAPRLRKEQARVDWSRSALDIHNGIRAFNPWPGAFSSFRGQLVKLWGSSISAEGHAGPAVPGVVLHCRERLAVGCGDGSTLDLAVIQPANRNRMTWLEFVNGFGVSPGEAFS